VLRALAVSRNELYLNALRQRRPREASPMALEILKTALIEAAQVRNLDRTS